MAPAIIGLGIFFAAIAIVIAILIFKKNSFDNSELKSAKIKIAGIILTALSAYDIFKEISNLLALYNEDWISYNVEESVGTALSQSISLTVLLLCFLLGIFLLFNKYVCVLASVAAIITMSLFEAIFAVTITAQYAYFSLLPSILVLSSLAFILTSINKHSRHFARYQKLLKIVPFFLLAELINTIITIARIQTFDTILIFTIFLIALKFIAFFLIFITLIPHAKKDENRTANTKFSSTEIIIILLSIIVAPVLIYFISSFSKVWLIAGGVLLAIALPFVLNFFADCDAVSKLIVVAITIAIVMGICAISKVLPKNTDTYDPNECFWCDGYGHYITETGDNAKLYICSHCNGSGRR